MDLKVIDGKRRASWTVLARDAAGRDLLSLFGHPLLNLEHQGDVTREVGIVLVERAPGVGYENEFLRAVRAQLSFCRPGPGGGRQGNGSRKGKQEMQVFHSRILGSRELLVKCLFCRGRFTTKGYLLCEIWQRDDPCALPGPIFLVTIWS